MYRVTELSLGLENVCVHNDQRPYISLPLPYETIHSLHEKIKDF